MKKEKTIFWIATIIIFIFEGVIPALTSRSEMSIQGITSLGYPVYFVTLLTVFKVMGAIALVVPVVPRRIKEWAYAGFGFDFIFAFLSLWIVTGFNATLLIPLVALAILAVSYKYYNRLNQSN